VIQQVVLVQQTPSYNDMLRVQIEATVSGDKYSMMTLKTASQETKTSAEISNILTTLSDQTRNFCQNTK